MSLRIRRGTDLERSTQLFDQGEIVYTTDTQRLYIGDGSTLGGIAATGFTTAEAQDAAASIFAGGSHSGITFTYNSTTNTMDADVIGGIGTTYGISAETSTGGVNLRLSGSDASADNVKFAEGSNITLTRTDASTITIASTASGSALTVKNEGANLTTSATSIDFVGAGVTATNVGDAVTVTIDGGGGGGATTLNDLTDVDVTGAVVGNVLKLNGSGTWVDGDLDLADLNDVSTSLLSTGQSLIWTGTAWTNGSQPVSVDTAPTLGGNLDLDGYSINGLGSIELSTETLTNSTISITTANDANTSSIIELSRANNTLLSPNPVINNDNLGGINFSGYDTVGYTLSSYVSSSVQGIVTPGNVPSRLLFGTTNSAGDLATRVTIDTEGTINALHGVTLISTGDSTSGSALLRTRRSRGTSSARTAVQIGDQLSQYLSVGHDGTDYFLGSSITSTVTNTVSAGIVPSSIVFSTTDVTGNLNDAVVITDNGDLRAINSVELFNVGSTQGGNNGLGMLRARGTLTSPTSIVDSDNIYQITARGYEGTNYTASSAIRFQHDPTHTISSGVVPGRMTFLTASTTGVLTSSFYIDTAQRIFSLKGITTVYDNDFGTSPLLLTSYGVSGGASPTTTANSLAMRRYRGTAAAPTALANGDAIFDIVWSGADGVNPLGVTAAVIRGKASATGSISAGIVPGQLIFQTRNNAGVLGTRISMDSYVTSFITMPKLPTYADETAANASVSAAGGAANGMMYYDTGAGKIKGYQGGAWVILQP
jgi:hypothetical protein